MDNSLGKLYLEMYPDSKIKDTHKIIGDFSNRTREIKTLDEIKIIDPCVGSGNFLLYGFDLFYDMYIDQIENYGADYSKREIPKLIIEKNLYGIDLDERAVQLTKVGLFIKAKTKRNSVHLDHYNVVSASFRLPEFNEIDTMFDAQFFSKDFNDLLSDVWKDLQQAHKFGSLLRIDEKFESKKAELKQELGEAQLSLFTYEKAAEFDLFANNFYEKLGDAIKKYAVDEHKKFVADETSNAMLYMKIVAEKYDIVVSNPPYTDSAAMGADIHDFIEKNYKTPYNCTTNLYACFIKRNMDYVLQNGYVAMIHPHTFMNIDTFKDVRRLLLSEGDISVLVDYGLDRVNLFGPGILLDAVWHITQKTINRRGRTYYFNITENQQEKYKKDSFEQAVCDVIQNNVNRRVSIIDPQVFKTIAGMPFMFNLSEGLRKKFEESSIEKAGIKVAQGMATSKNERFIRLWWEISEKFDLPIRDKWCRYAKGGPFCKWYGNNWATVNWKNNGQELRSYKKAVLRNQKYYLKEGITYTGSGSKGTTFRLHEENSLFDVGGSCIFPTGTFTNIEYLIAFLNSRLSFYLIDCLNPTVNTQVGDLQRVPFVKPQKEIESEISSMAESCISIKKKINSKYILNGAQQSPIDISTTVADALLDVIGNEIQDYSEILVNELDIDSKINEIYELNDADIVRMTEKIGVCVASIPIYEKAKELYLIESSNKNNAIISNIDIIQYDGFQITEIKKKISTILF